MNWSGYVAPTQADPYLGAAMEWIVPAVSTGGLHKVYSLVWAGTGTGLPTSVSSTADTLVQAGTGEDAGCGATCSTTETSYYFWEELYPQEPEQLVTNLSVSPGDDVGASTVYNPATKRATFQLYDFTTKQAVTDIQTLSGRDVGTGSQGEWIVERPTICTSKCIFPSLADFSTVSVTNATAMTGTGVATATTEPAGSYAPVKWIMQNCAGSRLLARPSPLTSATSFSVKWLNFGPTDSC